MSKSNFLLIFRELNSHFETWAALRFIIYYSSIWNLFLRRYGWTSEIGQ